MFSKHQMSSKFVFSVGRLGGCAPSLFSLQMLRVSRQGLRVCLQDTRRIGDLAPVGLAAAQASALLALFFSLLVKSLSSSEPLVSLSMSVVRHWRLGPVGWQLPLS